MKHRDPEIPVFTILHPHICGFYLFPRFRIQAAIASTFLEELSRKKYI